MHKNQSPIDQSREKQLSSWTLKNKELVHAIIKEEVDSRRVTVTTCQNLYRPFPDDSPYSETLYEQGINPDTIEELSPKKQVKLKRKVRIKKRTSAINKLK